MCNYIDVNIDKLWFKTEHTCHSFDYLILVSHSTCNFFAIEIDLVA